MSRNHSDQHPPSSSISINHQQSSNCKRFPLPPNNPHRQNKSNTHRAHQSSYPFWEIQDDIIAPTHSSLSIPSLERWARATAAFPQSGLGRREDVIVERIERRYGGGAEGDKRRYEGSTRGPRKREREWEREGKGDEGSTRDSMHVRKGGREDEGDVGVKSMNGHGGVVDLTGEEESEDRGRVIDLTKEGGDGEEEEVDYAR